MIILGARRIDPLSIVDVEYVQRASSPPVATIRTYLPGVDPAHRILTGGMSYRGMVGVIRPSAMAFLEDVAISWHLDPLSQFLLIDEMLDEANLEELLCFLLAKHGHSHFAIRINEDEKHYDGKAILQAVEGLRARTWRKPRG